MSGRLFARYFLAPFIGCLAFAFGLLTANVIQTNPRAPTATIQIVTLQSTPPSQTELIVRQANYEDDGLGCWGDENEQPRFGPIRVGLNRVVDTACGTLFMRDNKDLLVWRSNTGAPLTDSPKLVNGELVVIGFDLHVLGIDPDTGFIKWKHLANGRSAFVQLERIGIDRYLVLVDLSGYDDGYYVCSEKNPESSDSCPRTIPDELWLLRKDSFLKKWSVPAESKVVVRGTQVLVAVRRGKRSKEFAVANLRR